MQHEAKIRRDNAISMAMRRKEEYLGARVPKELRDRVILRAKEMGIPVSILIRNILEEAFRGDESNIPLIATAASQEKKSKKSDRYASVLGWEKIMLNKRIACSCCGVELVPGTAVTLGIGGSEPVVLCASCESLA